MSKGSRTALPRATSAGLIGAAVFVGAARAGDPPSAPPELGAVRWLRDFGGAMSQAQRSGRPALVLFDEVPGCETCVRYGQTALSHPLIVEAAETHFVPVAVFNNVDGADRAVLQSFNEKSWNNPVVRIIDGSRRDLTPRLGDDWTTAGLARHMCEGLRKAGATPPEYLSLLALEGAPGLERAAFAMHCFWEGEASLGALEGVARTRTGMLEGREVVEVTFDPVALPFDRLAGAAASMSCADRVFTTTDEQQLAAEAIVGDRAARSTLRIQPTIRDDKHAIAGGPWRFVPMTEPQASRVNAAVAAGRNGDPFLSPAQRRIAEAVCRNPDAEWPAAALGATDFRAAFQRAQDTAERLGAR